MMMSRTSEVIAVKNEISDIKNKIQAVENETSQIKLANPNWTTNSELVALITSLNMKEQALITSLNMKEQSLNMILAEHLRSSHASGNTFFLTTTYFYLCINNKFIYPCCAILSKPSGVVR